MRKRRRSSRLSAVWNALSDDSSHRPAPALRIAAIVPVVSPILAPVNTFAPAVVSVISHPVPKPSIPIEPLRLTCDISLVPHTDEPGYITPPPRPSSPVVVPRHHSPPVCGDKLDAFSRALAQGHQCPGPPDRFPDLSVPLHPVPPAEPGPTPGLSWWMWLVVILVFLGCAFMITSAAWMLWLMWPSLPVSNPGPVQPIDIGENFS
jgi:hypothetical protein